ncbi:hypothetical protein [Oceanirhabdus seepicola]|uniref:Uncharacterized protein n=1 Tax=Oceanirhabdus seepicola TaxID=2828781 RepID=A0A9J6PB46_9CLOT|nr:hypothetical protein [Oceanirhabdus seepicola]MCM1992841.1 hypothetical protein [Oceanirhabdus seepicola]
MKRSYDADPGYLTVNQAVDRMIQVIGKDNSKLRGRIYRKFINMAAENKIEYKKHGRAWWLKEEEVDKYIEEKGKQLKNNYRTMDENEEIGKITVEYIKDIIELLEKVGTPPDKILELLKVKLNMNDNKN